MLSSPECTASLQQPPQLRCEFYQRTKWYRTCITSPQRGSKSSFSKALDCTARRRIPASASTTQGLVDRDLRTTASQKCEAVSRRARISGSKTFVSLNSSIESNDEQEGDGTFRCDWGGTLVSSPPVHPSVTMHRYGLPAVTTSYW